MKIVNTFLLLIALTKSAYLLLASLASKTRVLYSESKAYKREPKPKNEVGLVSKPLLFFPAELLLHIVYISNILCGLEVIDSRRLQ